MELNTSVPRLEGKTATTGKSCGYILDGNSSLVLVAAVSQQGLRVERTAVVLALKLAVRLFCLWHTVPLLIDGNLRTVEI